MSAPKGDWRIECGAVVYVVFVAVSFAILWVILAID